MLDHWLGAFLESAQRRYNASRGFIYEDTELGVLVRWRSSPDSVDSCDLVPEKTGTSLKDVIHLISLGVEIFFVVGIGFDFDGDLLDDL